EGARAEEATRIARHEALHLLLSASLRGGERWNDPELAFADWIVRGIESGREPQVPRFHAPLPQLLARQPSSRAEVQKQLASPPGAARRYFGDALWLELSRVEGERRRRCSATITATSPAIGPMPSRWCGRTGGASGCRSARGRAREHTRCTRFARRCGICRSWRWWSRRRAARRQGSRRALSGRGSS